VRESEVTDNLLGNTLPAPIIAQLKNNQPGLITAYGTVLFADVVSFTVFSGTVSALELVELLNHMFTLFDSLA